MREIHYKDKLKHFIISFILAGALFWLTRSVTLTIIIILGLGIFKEIYDQAKGKNTLGESGADMLVNVVGITVGILAGQSLLRLF